MSGTTMADEERPQDPHSAGAGHHGRRLDGEEYRTIHDLSPTAILGIDPQGHVFRMNPAAERLFLVSGQDFLGKTFGDITHPDDREASRQGFQALVEGKVDEVGLEKRYIRSDGKIIWAEIRAVAVREEDGSLQHILSLINDVTDRRRHLEELELFQRIVRAMDDAPDMEGAYGAVLDKIVEYTGWAIGEAWVPGDDGELHCMAPHSMGRAGLEKFRRLSERITFAPGQGLPGQAFERAEAVWSTDLKADRTFTRATNAIAAGLHAGLGVPVLVDGRPVAVLDFLMDQAGPEDEDRVHLVSAVAAQLGAMTERWRAGQRLEDHHRILTTVAEAAAEAFVVISLDGSVLAADRGFLEMCGVLGDDARTAEEILPEIQDDPDFQHAISFLYTVNQRAERDQLEWRDVLYRRRSVPLKSRDGTVEGRIFYFRAIADLA